MTIEEAARILNERYSTAPTGEKVVRIHLFGIEFADQLSSLPLKEVAVRAKISESYATEIQKGITLSQFVELKR